MRRTSKVLKNLIREQIKNDPNITEEQKLYLKNKNSRGSASFKRKLRRKTITGHLQAINDSHNARARRNGVKGVFSLIEWQNRIYEFKGLCAYCQQPLKEGEVFAADHFFPLKHKLATNYIFNIVPACALCNGKKFNKGPEKFCKSINREDLYKRMEEERVKKWAELKLNEDS